MSEKLEDPFTPIDNLRIRRLGTRLASAVCGAAGSVLIAWGVSDSEPLSILYGSISLAGGFALAEESQSCTSEILSRTQDINLEVEKFIYSTYDS